MSRRRLDAIVVGAGLVGSAAALGLARAGLPSPPSTPGMRVRATCSFMRRTAS